MTAADILRKYEATIRSLPHVTGIGIDASGEREVIIVFVDRKIPESQLSPREIVPKGLDGYHVDVREAIRVGGTVQTGQPNT